MLLAGGIQQKMAFEGLTSESKLRIYKVDDKLFAESGANVFSVQLSDSCTRLN